MLPDRVSNPGPLTYESGALPIALRGPKDRVRMWMEDKDTFCGVMQRTGPRHDKNVIPYCPLVRLTFTCSNNEPPHLHLQCLPSSL